MTPKPSKQSKSSKPAAGRSPQRRRPRVAGTRPKGESAGKRLGEHGAGAGSTREVPQEQPGEQTAQRQLTEDADSTVGAGVTGTVPEADATSEDATDADGSHGDGSHGDAAEGEPAEADAEEQPAPRRPRHGLKAAVVLFVVALVLIGFTVFAGLQRGHAAVTNTALTDATTTQQVQSQVSAALNTLLTFDYKHPNANDSAAGKYIDGQLADCSGSQRKQGYQQLIGVLKRSGPKQQLTLHSTVLSSGVQVLHGDKARVLVLLNQEYSKGTGKNATHRSALAAAVVDAVNTGGHWRLRRLCLQ